MTQAATIAAGHPETAAAARAILDSGGNAMDAAVAACLAAFVAEPLLASAGGGGLLLYGDAEGQVECFDFFPDVPGRGLTQAEPQAQNRDFHAVEIDFGEATQTFHVGRASVCVPNVLEGLAQAISDAGRMSLEDVAAPAITLAQRGSRLGKSGAEVFRLLWPILSMDQDSLRLLANGDEIPGPDTLLRNEPYAQLLCDWSNTGRVPQGFQSALLTAFGHEQGGSITAADIEAATPRKFPARRVQLGDWALHLTDRPGADAIESMMADVLREPRSGDAQLALALARAAVRAEELKHDPTVRGSTTHISVCDTQGQVASVTLSNGEGAGYTLRDYGVQPNNFLGEGDLNPGGFFRHAPGARLPTMMAPTIARQANQGRIVALGSGGANRIRSAVTRVLEAHLRGGHSIEQAVAAPRVHAEGDTVWFERCGWGDLDAVESILREHFARVIAFDEPAFFFGGVHSVSRNPDESSGAGDSRRGGVSLKLEV